MTGHSVALVTLEAVDFTGCSQGGDSTGCNCETWAPTECDACGEEMHNGDPALILTRSTLPFLDDADPEQDWETFIWHPSCDRRAAQPGEPT
jgi:hypothetical protein